MVTILVTLLRVLITLSEYRCPAGPHGPHALSSGCAHAQRISACSARRRSRPGARPQYSLADWSTCFLRCRLFCQAAMTFVILLTKADDNPNAMNVAQIASPCSASVCNSMFQRMADAGSLDNATCIDVLYFVARSELPSPSSATQPSGALPTKYQRHTKRCPMYVATARYFPTSMACCQDLLIAMATGTVSRIFFSLMRRRSRTQRRCRFVMPTSLEPPQPGPSSRRAAKTWRRPAQCQTGLG